MIRVDHKALKEETLINLLTEIVLREGTDYGAQMISHKEKVNALHEKLNAGKIALIFLEAENYCDVINISELSTAPFV
jgi:uncharacterized protein